MRHNAAMRVVFSPRMTVKRGPPASRVKSIPSPQADPRVGRVSSRLSLPTRGVLMRIAMASDHAGRALKEEIKALLRADGHEVSDFGTDTDDAADLPDHV